MPLLSSASPPRPVPTERTSSRGSQSAPEPNRHNQSSLDMLNAVLGYDLSPFSLPAFAADSQQPAQSATQITRVSAIIASMIHFGAN